MNSSFIPGLIDASKHIEDAVTKTASYNGESIDLGSGFAPGGLGDPLAAVVTVTALDHTTGDETYTMVLQESSDNATFTACGPVVTVAAIGAFTIPGWVSKRYIRVALVEAGTT